MFLNMLEGLVDQNWVPGLGLSVFEFPAEFVGSSGVCWLLWSISSGDIIRPDSIFKASLR